MPVDPYQYSPTPAGERGGQAVTKDWDKELGGGVASGQLPAGYNKYVQGFDPVQNKWMYNPNTGAKYGTLANGSWGELPQTNVLTQGAAPSAAAQPATTPTRGAPNPGATFTNPQGLRTAPAQPAGYDPFRDGTMGAGVVQPTTPPAAAAQPSPGGVPAGTHVVQGIAGPVTLDAQGNPVQDGMMDMAVVRNPDGSIGSPTTGVGAGRAYPSNWNMNQSPGLDNGNTPFAVDPNTGASYEVSPMYQWQMQQGLKNLRRQLQAGGRLNSSVGYNAQANFLNQLGAQEANQQYQREYQQQVLGMQAALAQAAQQGASASQLAQMYMQMGGALQGQDLGYGNSILNAINLYMQNQGSNVLGAGGAVANAAIGSATGQAPYVTQQGQARGDIYAGWGQVPGQFINAYNWNRLNQPNVFVNGPQPNVVEPGYDPNFGVPGAGLNNTMIPSVGAPNIMAGYWANDRPMYA